MSIRRTVAALRDRVPPVPAAELLTPPPADDAGLIEWLVGAMRASVEGRLSPAERAALMPITVWLAAYYSARLSGGASPTGGDRAPATPDHTNLEPPRGPQHDNCSG